MNTIPTCSIIILNYNGREHLRYLLPTVRQAVKQHPTPVPVVVVDNRSTEPDVAYLQEHFPEVEVMVAERNDYLFSLNPIVASRDEDVVILLNNDMRVDPGFIAPLLRHFDDPDVFAAIPQIYDWEGTVCTNGQRIAHLRRFIFYTTFDNTVVRPSYTLEAGCGAFRREHFAALGGYDPLYRPGYWEDVDLSYRAWMRGWRCIYEPRSAIYHRVRATFGKQIQESRHRRLDIRNQILFTLKNIGGWGFVLAYLALLPIRAVRQLADGDSDTALATWAGLPLLSQALQARRRDVVQQRMPPRAVEAAIREPFAAENSTPLASPSPALTCNEDRR
jgi:GT2 family glycosyltransferase